MKVDFSQIRANTELISQRVAELKAKNDPQYKLLTENPQMLIGYNVFAFDWSYILDRAEELHCKDDIMKELSINIFEESKVKKSTTKVASGTYDLTYVKMNGRLQIDLYAYFKKSVNLPSYKLDTVSSVYFGDTVKNHEIIENGLRIYSGNLMGLKQFDYVKLEIINHSIVINI